jgi:hypothetical protein
VYANRFEKNLKELKYYTVFAYRECMHKILTIVIIIFFCREAFSQKRFFIKADSIVSVFYYNSGFDTSYVLRPRQRFMIAVHPDFSSIGLSIGKNDERANFYTNLSDNIGALATYRGYGFGYSFKPRRGRKNDGEFNFRFFCRRFGIETDFSRATSFSCDIHHGDSVLNIERGDIDYKMRIFSIYYVFNNKKFSFPAAFDKSYTQVCSCGSPLLGISYVDANMKTSKHDFELHSQTAGIGCGYGYNFVTKRKFLIHASLIPTFLLWENNEVYTSQGPADLKYKITDIGIYFRAAASYNFERTYLGADYVLYTTIFGGTSDFMTNFSRNIIRLLFGFWF